MIKNKLKQTLCSTVLICALCLLSACASKDKSAKSGQADISGESTLVSDNSADNASRMTNTIAASTEAIYPNLQANTDESLDDYDVPQATISDPLEPWNRFWFGFNDIFYLHVARPLYTGYEFLTPSEFRTGLKNFLANILFPIRFVNALLQGKLMEAGVEFSRFMLNTTGGFGGFIDLAKGAKVIVPVDPSGEDFGQTLGVWGIGQGFYVVWPLIGPSSARDSVGLAGDYFLSPTFYLPTWTQSFIVTGTLRFNSVGDILSLYEDMDKSAVDPYVAMREAYATYRQLRLGQ